MPVRALLSLLLVASLFPAAARAADSNFCPDNTAYSGTATCRFVFRGTPIWFWGESNATAAQVTVWVTVEGYPELGPIARCTASGAGFARCEKRDPQGAPAFRVPHGVGTFYLRCHVSGAGFGRYRCQSAEG